MGYIYRITNLINGKSYIGETKQADVRSRWKNHTESLKTKNGATALMAAFEKYGIENFKFEVIIICFDEDRLVYEADYIQKFNTITPNGYNISKGRVTTEGFNSSSFKEFLKSKRKQGEVNLKKTLSLTVNIRERMQNSEKWHKALAEKKMGNFKNRKHSEEEKRKISDSVKKYFQGNGSRSVNREKHIEIMTKVAGKAVDQYSLDGEFIKTHKSIRAASRYTGINHATIYLNLVQKAKKAGDYTWKYHCA